jgi:hypothetical protein
VVQLDKLITVFSSIPGPVGSMIVDPYQCTCGLRVQRDKEEYRCQIRVEGLAKVKHAVVQVHLRADKADCEGLVPTAISPVLSVLHSLVGEMFEGVFTKEAKEAFEPDDIPTPQQ